MSKSMLPAPLLRKMYFERRTSMADMARALHCSLHKVSYRMEKHRIHRRSISDAIYLWSNPGGDPFR